MAGRDMAAIAVGLDEVTDAHYLEYRTTAVRYMVEKLQALGVPVLTPAGGHAVYLDASAMLPDVPRGQFPGHAVACALYVEGGIRSCEIGSLMFGAKAGSKPELVRLAFPRRVYTQSHIDLAIEVCVRVHELCKAGAITGMQITHGAESPLRHFSAKMKPLPVHAFAAKPRVVHAPKHYGRSDRRAAGLHA
jgi:tryptophanase